MEKTIILADIFERYDNGVASLVSLACTFEGKIYLIDNTKRINAKSIMGLMAFQFTEGKEITIFTEGNDQSEALEQIANYLSK